MFRSVFADAAGIIRGTTGRTPPAGEDIPTPKQLTAMKAEAARTSEAAAMGDDEPFNADAFLEEKKPPMPRTENGILIVPVRARDFRMVEVE